MSPYNFLTLSSFEETVQKWLAGSSTRKILTRDDYNKIKSILPDPTSKIADLKITMTDIKKNWEGMRQDLIKELVKKCITCASRKTLMKSRLM